MELDTGEVIGQYRVESVLGQGGMAIVYRVRHQQLGSEHALKLLMVNSKSIQARLLQEGRVQATLRHANIVSVTDVVSIGRSMGLVMELVKGPTLEDLLAQGSLLQAQFDMLAQGILEGVAAAHRSGLIHRDLKPANILLELGHGRITPKVTDFGLAKVLGNEGGTSQTRSGVAMGTPHYMAPEQIRDAKNVDARTDVFALGAILYEMVTSKKAFPGEDMLTIFSAIVEGNPTPVREFSPDLPDHMLAAIEGALVADREERIPSTDALLSMWKNEELTEPGMGSGDSWTDELMAKAVAISHPDKPLHSVPSMDTVSDTQTPRTESLGERSSTLSPLSSSDSTDSLGGGTWTDELIEEELLAEPETSAGVPTGRILGVVGLVAAALLGVVVVVTGNSSPEQDVQSPAVESVFDAPQSTETTPTGAEPSADEAPATAAPTGPAPRARAQSHKKKPIAKTPKKGIEKTRSPPAVAETPPPQVGRSKESTPAPSVPAVRAAAAVKPRLPPPGKAWLKLDPAGDSVTVYLRSTRGTFRPGDDIPAGSYSLQAFFVEGKPQDVGSINLKNGDVRTLKCTKAFVSCRVK
jgi:serine/threonine protein kinase